MTSLHGAQVRESPAKPAPPRRSARGHYCTVPRYGQGRRRITGACLPSLRRSGLFRDLSALHPARENRSALPGTSSRSTPLPLLCSASHSCWPGLPRARGAWAWRDVRYVHPETREADQTQLPHSWWVCTLAHSRPAAAAAAVGEPVPLHALSLPATRPGGSNVGVAVSKPSVAMGPSTAPSKRSDGPRRRLQLVWRVSQHLYCASV
jgi:hypothetical protein